MKILYAVQGTGNGHMARAMDIIPLLQRKGEVDVLVSGTQADLTLPFDVKYKLRGLSFIFGKSGGVDLTATFKRASFWSLLREILKLDLKSYDLVINDFEPVSAWAAKLRGVHCVSLSHQCAVKFSGVPRPKSSDLFGETILKFYAPSKSKYGFHFEVYNDKIYTPVIREAVRDQDSIRGDYYTVYLPSFSEEYLIKKLKKIKNTKWQVFSKHTKNEFLDKNVRVSPLNNEKFISSMAGAKGVLCGAGFETPAEALYLKKKLIVIPMKNQLEQQYNAAALKKMGVMVIKNLKKENLIKLQYWCDHGKLVKVDYYNRTNDILNTLLENEYYAKQKKVNEMIGSAFSIDQ